MTEFESRCLDTFPEWLRTLHTDALDIAGVLRNAAAPEPALRYFVGGLNYLFKSLDLIPDGIEDLGYLDDAFVLRVAASLALAEWPEARESAPAVVRLGAETKLIEELLGSEYGRIVSYVNGLAKGAARGRSVDDILATEEARTAFLGEVSGWASSYAVPTFSRDEKNVVKLQTFLLTKLPPA